jgi:hypothetical protein
MRESQIVIRLSWALGLNAEERGETQKTDRIMAGQNHAEQRQKHCWQDHKPENGS